MTPRERVARALNVVRRDLAQLDLADAGFEIRAEQGGFRIHRFGLGHGWLVSGDDDVTDQQLLVDVADEVQFLVSNNVGDSVWPVCRQHNFGLHPELDNGTAAWVCRPRCHVVARIGELT